MLVAVRFYYGIWNKRRDLMDEKSKELIRSKWMEVVFKKTGFQHFEDLRSWFHKERCARINRFQLIVSFDPWPFPENIQSLVTYLQLYRKIFHFKYIWLPFFGTFDYPSLKIWRHPQSLGFLSGLGAGLSDRLPSPPQSFLLLGHSWVRRRVCLGAQCHILRVVGSFVYLFVQETVILEHTHPPIKFFHTQTLHHCINCTRVRWATHKNEREIDARSEIPTMTAWLTWAENLHVWDDQFQGL